jgi:thymidylate kinase
VTVVASTWVAIEGPCCAGKTTLGDGLRDRLGADHVAIIPDYADYVGGAPGMPSPDPSTLPDELAALDFLLDVEKRRFASHLPAPPPPIVLIDRSVLTLSAHCAGLDWRHADRSPFLADVDTRLAADPRPRRPEFVLYLDVSHPVQVRRNDGKFASESIFMDEAYNAGFRSWFARAHDAQKPQVSWIDSQQPVAAVLDEAMRHFWRWGIVEGTA